jgi:hypothetical protein
MRTIVPLSMARLYFFTVGADETLLAADSGRINKLWALWIACVGKMGLISGREVALSLGVELGIAVAELGALERDIGAAVWAGKAVEVGVGVGWSRRAWILLKRLWADGTRRPLAVHCSSGDGGWSKEKK